MFGTNDYRAFRQLHALIEHYKGREAMRETTTFSAKLKLDAKGYTVELILINARQLLVELTSPTEPPWPEGHTPLRVRDDDPLRHIVHAPPLIVLHPEHGSLWSGWATTPRALHTGDAAFDQLRAHSDTPDAVLGDTLHRLKVRQAVLGLVNLHVHPIRIYGPRHVVSAMVRDDAIFALLRPDRINRLIRLMADLADAIPPVRIDPTLPAPPPPEAAPPPPGQAPTSLWARLRARFGHTDG